MIDDLVLQSIESTANVITRKEGYSDFNSFHTKRLASAPLSPTRLFTARGVTRLLRGKADEEYSVLEKAID